MDKKNRTGLQSKISQIFAGVPMPRKRKPLSENPPENKTENSDLLQVPQNEVVIEPLSLVQDENIIELSLSEEPVVEQAQGTQPHPVEKLTDNKIPATEAEPPSIHKLSEELPEALFTVEQEHDIELKPSEKVKTGGSEQVERKISDNAIQAEPSADSLEGLVKSQLLPAQPLESRQQVKKTSLPESKTAKPSVDVTIPAPPVKEPGVEKQSPLSNQKPHVGKVSRIETATKKDLTVSRKVAPKSVSNHLKTKAVAGKPKQKTMVVLFVVFSILLVLILGKQFGVFSGSDTSGTIEPPIPPAKIKTSGITIGWEKPPVYNAKRDPMVLPSNISGNNEGGFIVDGISFGKDGQGLVLINTVHYKLGSKIQGYDAEIINITLNNVEFKNSEGKTWTQALGEKRTN